MVYHQSKILSISLVAIIAFGFGIFSFYAFDAISLQIKSEKFPLTNPSLKYSELREVLMANKTLNMSGVVSEYVLAQQKAGKISQFSMYFRNLNNGGWFGINEKDNFSPASLMKLPILLAYVKKSEKEKGFLNQKVLYKKSAVTDTYRQNIASQYQLEDGHMYTWREILQNLIVYSDNDSAAFLSQHIPLEEIKQIFVDVGIPFPQYTGGNFDNNINVIDYATFFRKLYNSSYLTIEDSEKVLDILSKVAFQDGLIAGVPSNITVAHKFGERGIIQANGSEEKQLHDCGIVYYPQYPYILCVMTRGYSLPDLENVISNISKLVYSQVDSVYSGTNNQ